MATQPSASTKSYALRFISGKYQGGELVLPQSKEIIIGRSSELDMVLVEDMVSRRHAKLTVSGSDIFIQDLGSTNGTFVNGEKITSAQLSEGDRILIGTSIIKLVDAANIPLHTVPPRTGEMSSGATHTTSPVRTMSGSIDEVPLPDLLQLFGTSKKSGVLIVRTTEELGRIYLDKGAIVFAVLGENFDTDPYKAFYRILTWQSGAFELEQQEFPEFPRTIDSSTEALLMEAMRRLDEMNRISEEMPTMTSRLGLSTPLVPSLRDLQVEELEMLQLAINHGRVSVVLDKSDLDDLKALKTLQKLLSSGYLRVTD